MQFCQPIPFQALLGHENKTFCGLCTHRKGTPQLKVHCSADPQNKLRRQPQKATNMPGGRVRVPSHGAVCVIIAKHESEEHGYSWVISLTNGTSAHPCVPCRREQGKEAEGSLHGPAGHLGLLWATLCRTNASFPASLAQPPSLWQKLATVQADTVECCCCWSAAHPARTPRGVPLGSVALKV